MTDSDKLSSKNQKMMENIEQSMKDTKKTSSTDNNVDVNETLTSKEPGTTQTKSQNQSDDTKVSGITTPLPNNPEVVKQKGNGGVWLVTIINFLLIVCIIAAAYWYYTQIAGGESQQQSSFNSLSQNIEMIEQNVQRDIQRVNQNISSVESSVESALRQQEQNYQSSLSQMQSEINTNATTGDALSQKLAEVSGRRPSDWLLAEANYLVNMAGRKLYLEQDVKTAITLLQEADARLVDLNDPSLFPVRALIAGDIQALNQVNPTSTVSIALSIGGILPKIGDLPLDTLQLPESTNDDDLTLSEDISDWEENIWRTWRAIVGDLITIDYANEPLEPYLAERQQWLIEQQLKHSLTQAQTAALDEQVTLYQSSMQRAIALIIEHYKLDDTQVSQLLVALQELQNIDFAKNYPEKLESQASLSDIIKRRVQGVFNNQLDNGGLKLDEGNKL